MRSRPRTIAQVARTLLAERNAEDLVATLVNLRREARPAPEELTIPPSMRPRHAEPSRRPEPPRRGDRPFERTEPRRHERPFERSEPRRGDRPAERPPFERLEPRRYDAVERTEGPPERVERRVGEQPFEPPDRRRSKPAPAPRPRDEAQEAVWFTINIGRSKNADPKWLIPLLCRRGGITKSSIGKIQILARETRVEIAAQAAEKFAAQAKEPDAKDRNIHIERLDPDAI